MLKGSEGLGLLRPVTFLVGEDGGGKSTLLEAIAMAYGLNPEGGTRNYSFSTYDSYSGLCEALKISGGYRKTNWGYFLQAKSFYNVATKESEYSDSEHPSKEYREKSHGESFLTLAQNQLKANGVYLLDKPEATLSPQRQLTPLMKIYECARGGAQFVIVTHPPILLGMPGVEIMTLDDGTIHSCEYEDTGSYQITETFINNRKQVLNRLLDDG